MDGSLPLPPEQLRFNVSNSRDVSEFLEVGKRCAEELEAGVAAVGGSLFILSTRSRLGMRLWPDFAMDGRTR